MTKFCGKCGSPIDEKTGLCPKCSAVNQSASAQPPKAPVQQKPVQQKPAQQRPVQQRPVQQNPAQQRPVQQKPVQQNPAQQRPVQQRPVQQNPAQQRPVQQNPAQQRPVQQNPAQQKPVQPKPEKPKISREEKKAKKKAETEAIRKEILAEQKASRTSGQKVGRFFIKLIAIILAVAIVAGSVVGALQYYNKINIPFVASVLDKLGIQNEKTEEQLAQGEEGKEGESKLPEKNKVTVSRGKFTTEKISDSSAAIAAVRNAAEDLGLQNIVDDLSVEDETEVGNLVYYRMQQNYKGIPVYGKNVIVVTDRYGDAKSLSSNAVDLNIDIKKDSFVSKSDIIDQYKDSLGENVSESDVKMFIMPDSQKVVYIINTIGESLIFDATSGDVIQKKKTLFEQRATCYNNEKDEDRIEFTGSYDEATKIYSMFDEDKNIRVRDLKKTNSDDINDYEDYDILTSSDEIFGNTKQESNSEYGNAVKVMKQVNDAYDYFYRNYNNEDGFGSLTVFVNDSFDSGKNARGGGDVTNGGILSIGYIIDVNIDIIGHEYTHMVTRKRVNWDKAGDYPQTDETGAINEGYSDIFGELIEAYSSDSRTPDWRNQFRNIANPSVDGYPAKVGDKKTEKFKRASDNKEVYGLKKPDGNYTDYSHGFSTIISHAAYLMNTGTKNSTTTLDIDRLSELWYHTMLNLTSDCTFLSLREEMLQTATNLNFSEEEKKLIRSAFDEVGIKSEEEKIKSERDIVLVLDMSGSMSGEKIDQTKIASCNFIESAVDNDANIAVVIYDDSATMISDFSRDKSALKDVVNSIGTGGGTNIESGLVEADNLLSKGKAKKKIIVLMSDGEPNEGKLGDELVNYAGSIKDKGTYIYTLGFFGNSGNVSEPQKLMERISSPGCHYEVTDPDSLRFFFDDIANQINGTRYIYIRIACPVDVTVECDGEKLCSREDSVSTRTDFGVLSFEDTAELDEEEEGGSTGKKPKDNRVKILRLKEGVDYDIEIEGNGSGKMNYTIGFLNEDGEYKDMRKFRNVKITSDTEINTVATHDNKTVLNVDEDGDGKVDIIYEAKENERAKDYSRVGYFFHQIMIPLIVVAVILALVLGFVLYKKIKMAVEISKRRKAKA